jgi:hypothetical protein
MEPREKAIELYNKFYDMATVVIDMKVKKYVTKECVIVAVNQIIEELYEWGEVWMKRRIIYWQEVKQEIEKL